MGDSSKLSQSKSFKMPEDDFSRDFTAKRRTFRADIFVARGGGETKVRVFLNTPWTS
jgi:hypothetical protein